MADRPATSGAANDDPILAALHQARLALERDPAAVPTPAFRRRARAELMRAIEAESRHQARFVQPRLAIMVVAALLFLLVALPVLAGPGGVVEPFAQTLSTVWQALEAATRPGGAVRLPATRGQGAAPLATPKPPVAALPLTDELGGVGTGAWELGEPEPSGRAADDVPPTASPILPTETPAPSPTATAPPPTATISPPSIAPAATLAAKVIAVPAAIRPPQRVAIATEPPRAVEPTPTAERRGPEAPPTRAPAASGASEATAEPPREAKEETSNEGSRDRDDDSRKKKPDPKDRPKPQPTPTQKPKPPDAKKSVPAPPTPTKPPSDKRHGGGGGGDRDDSDDDSDDKPEAKPGDSGASKPPDRRRNPRDDEDSEDSDD